MTKRKDRVDYLHHDFFATEKSEDETVSQIVLSDEQETLYQTKRTVSATDTKKIVQSFKKDNKDKGLRVFVAGGSRSGNNPIYQEEAYRLGEEIAKKGFKLNFGLSGIGIMGAVAKGMLKVWASKQKNKGTIPIKGITTEVYQSFTQQDDIVLQIHDVIVAHSLEERKNQLLAADFVIFATGGLGTLDELVYDCVAMQDGFLPFKPFIIFNVEGFYHHILEFLKEIHFKGFANQMPFIVVDNSYEAGVVFDILKHKWKTNYSKEKVLDLVQSVIYELPYILQQKQENPNLTVASIYKQMKSSSSELIAAQIEKAYIHKEIERMYGRLERAGLDTARVSRKLVGLKEQRRKVGS